MPVSLCSPYCLPPRPCYPDRCQILENLRNRRETEPNLDIYHYCPEPHKETGGEACSERRMADPMVFLPQPRTRTTHFMNRTAGNSSITVSTVHPGNDCNEPNTQTDILPLLLLLPYLFVYLYALVNPQEEGTRLDCRVKEARAWLLLSGDSPGPNRDGISGPWTTSNKGPQDSPGAQVSEPAWKEEPQIHRNLCFLKVVPRRVHVLGRVPIVAFVNVLSRIANVMCNPGKCVCLIGNVCYFCTGEVNCTGIDISPASDSLSLIHI